jgi:hypothetical protein
MGTYLFQSCLTLLFCGSGVPAAIEDQEKDVSKNYPHFSL